MDQNFTLAATGLEAFDGSEAGDCWPFTTRGVVRELVVALLPDKDVAAVFLDDDVLAEIGLTSLGMIGLLLALEARFDFEVPRSEINSEVFKSVSTVDALVGRLLARTATSAGLASASVGRTMPWAPGVARHAAG